MFKTMTTAIVLLAAVAAAHAEPPRDCTGCVVAGFPASSKEVDLAVSLEMAIKTNNLVACPDGPTCMPDSAFAPFIARGDQLIHEAWSTLDQREKNCLEQAKGSDVAVLDACIPPPCPDIWTSCARLSLAGARPTTA